jgi:hypothetical protein
MKKSLKAIIFINFHYLCGPVCPTKPPSPHKALGNGVARCFALPFRSQICKSFFKEYSESSFPDGYNDTNMSSHLGLV